MGDMGNMRLLFMKGHLGSTLRSVGQISNSRISANFLDLGNIISYNIKINPIPKSLLAVWVKTISSDAYTHKSKI